MYRRRDGVAAGRVHTFLTLDVVTLGGQSVLGVAGGEAVGGGEGRP
jgi:hypothetical protein